jgi:hypothetical protein
MSETVYGREVDSGIRQTPSVGARWALQECVTCMSRGRKAVGGCDELCWAQLLAKERQRLVPNIGRWVCAACVVICRDMMCVRGRPPWAPDRPAMKCSLQECPPAL